MRTPQLSVVLPVRNQADHITGVVEEYLKAFRGKTWEIILVPNASNDLSPQVCRKLSRNNKSIRVVENFAGGWGLSVRKGLAVARGLFVCYANSARTNPATVLKLFEQVVKRPESLGKITRHTRGHFFREVGSLLYNFECRTLFHLNCGDVNGTPKIFKANLLRRISLISNGDLLDAEILARCKQLQVPVFEIPLSEWNRHGGESTTSIKSAMRMYGGAIRLWLNMK